MADGEEVEGEGEGKSKIMVSKDRLDREIAAKTRAKTRADELEAQLADLEQKHGPALERARTAETLAAQVEALKAEQLMERAAWDEERGAYRAGITDPEGVDIARLLHSKLPEKDRPSLGDWLGDLRKDPSKAHKALQPYLGQADRVAEDPAAKTVQGAATGRKHGTGQLATGGQLSAESIRALTAEAAKTGDYTALREAMAQYRGAMGLPQHQK